jgi:hypothetical protein
MAQVKWLKVYTIRGPWASLGIHIDLQHRHIDLHILWWIIVLGNTVEVIYCGYCHAELTEGQDCICEGFLGT